MLVLISRLGRIVQIQKVRNCSQIRVSVLDNIESSKLCFLAVSESDDKIVLYYDAWREYFNIKFGIKEIQKIITSWGHNRYRLSQCY